MCFALLVGGFMNNNQFEFLDVITVFTAIIQVMDYQLTVEQASNDDILKELRKDMIILQNQNQEIIKLLKENHTKMKIATKNV